MALIEAAELDESPAISHHVPVAQAIDSNAFEAFSDGLNVGGPIKRAKSVFMAGLVHRQHAQSPVSRGASDALHHSLGSLQESLAGEDDCPFDDVGHEEVVVDA